MTTKLLELMTSVINKLWINFTNYLSLHNIHAVQMTLRVTLGYPQFIKLIVTSHALWILMILLGFQSTQIHVIQQPILHQEPWVVVDAWILLIYSKTINH